MSSRVFTHLFRVSLASRIFYSSQRLHMEVNTSRNYHNINTHMDVVENKTDENRKEMEMHMENNMLELQNSMSSMILHSLHERLPIGYIKMQGNHESIEEINIDSQNHDYSLLQDPYNQGFKSTPMNYFIPNIDMRKFGGKDSITWIFQMEQFFDLHQKPSLQKVPIESLYL
jgi:hypothetical protein